MAHRKTKRARMAAWAWNGKFEKILDNFTDYRDRFTAWAEFS